MDGSKSLLRWTFLLMLIALWGCDETRTRTSKRDTTPKETTPVSERASFKEFLVEPPPLKLPDGATRGGTLRAGFSRAQLRFDRLSRHPDRVPIVNGLIQSTLAPRQPDSPRLFNPGLAKSVKISEDGKTFIIKLEEGVRWPTPPHPRIEEEAFSWLAEPHEVVAEDLLFTISLFFGEAQKRAEATGFEDMTSIKALDTHTVEIKWKYSSHEALVHLLSLRLLPKWLFARDEKGNVVPDPMILPAFEKHWAHAYPIGTGPYRVRASRGAVGISLVRNEHYHGEAPLIDAIELLEVEDHAQKLALLVSGDLDLALLAPPDLSELEGKDHLANAPMRLFTYYFIGYNNARAPFDSKKVRVAMSHSVDRERLLEEAFEGAATLVHSPLIQGHDGISMATSAPPFSLEEAAKLLDEAGVKDTDGDGIREYVKDGERVPFTFTLQSYDRPDWDRAVAIWREDLTKLGVTLEVAKSPSPARSPAVFKRDFDAMIGGWGTGYANRLHEIWHSSRGGPRGMNYVQYKDPIADALLADIQESHDMSFRLEQLRTFDVMINEAQPYTFLFMPHRSLVWNTRVENVHVDLSAPQISPTDWYIPEERRLKSLDAVIEE